MKNKEKVDFFIVGAARSGTTSLYNYLKQHPEIYLSNIKELNFFSNVEAKDTFYYKKPDKDKHYHAKIIKSLEVYHEMFENAKDNQVKGDISPSYLWDQGTAKRIQSYNPDAKIVMTLRNPIERAFSHYVMNYGIGEEKNETFDKALAAETKRIWGGGNAYLEMSLYATSVKEYYSYFKPENILVLIFEDWVKNRENTIEKIFKFLEVDPSFKVDLSGKHNEKVAYKNLGILNFLRGKYLKSIIEFFISEERKNKMKQKLFVDESLKIQLDSNQKTRLKPYFREDVRQLEDILDKSLLDKWELKEN